MVEFQSKIDLSTSKKLSRRDLKLIFLSPEIIKDDAYLYLAKFLVGVERLEKDDYERLKNIFLDEKGNLSLRLIRSIGGLFRRKKQIFNNFERVYELINFCKDEDKRIDYRLLSSITGMYTGKGAPDEEGMKKIQELKEFCTDDKGNFDKALFSSITGMYNGRGAPDDKGMEKIQELKEFCTIDGKFDKALFSSITGMYKGRGAPDEEGFEIMLKIKNFYFRNLSKADIEIIGENNGKILGKIIRLVLLGDNRMEDLLHYLELALNKLGTFLTECSFLRDKLPSNFNFSDHIGMLQFVIDNLSLEHPFTLWVIMKILRLNILGLEHILRYGDRSQPLMMSLDSYDKDGEKRSPHEVIGKEDESLLSLDFRLLMQNLVNDPRLEKVRELLERLGQGEDLSPEDYEKIAAKIREYPDLLEVFLLWR